MATATYTPRLKEQYLELRPQLQEELGLSSIMQVPEIAKITLNMGVGDAKTDAKALDAAIEELTTIAGQRAQVRKARKSIASFKLREGMAVGTRVTLRGARMYEFLDRLVFGRATGGSATSAASTRAGSTAAATTRSASASRSSSRRSTTTRSRRSGVLIVTITTSAQTTDEQAFSHSCAGLGAPRSPGRTTEGISNAWPRRLSVVKQKRGSKFKVRNLHALQHSAAARARVYKKFGLCRICLRELAHNGSIPGMTKSSW